MAEHCCNGRLFTPGEDWCEACDEAKQRRESEFNSFVSNLLNRKAAADRFVKGLRPKHIEALEAAVRHRWLWADREEEVPLEQLCEQLKKLYAQTNGKTTP
jgi:hypothetical protein